MLRKSAATLLLLLIASPFTAPFETCDVSTLFGCHTPAAQDQYQDSWVSTCDQSAIALAGSARRTRIRGKVASPLPAGVEPDSRPPVAIYFRDVTCAPAPPAATISHTPLRI